MIRRAYLIALGLSVVVSTSLISIVFLYNVYPETWSPSHFPEVDRYMRVNGTDGVGMGNGNGNGTGVAPVQVTPGKWTSETMEPKFGYAMYATDLTYFCNTIINANRLLRFGAKHDIIILYAEEWDGLPASSREQSALLYAQSISPQIVLQPMSILSTSSGDPTWSNSLSKFAVFQLSNYSRILYFDSDSLVLNSMDHYFLAPLARIAIPRAYWLDEKQLHPSTSSAPVIALQTFASHVMLIQPNQYTYDTIRAEAQRTGEFDMEVVNELFGKSAMILPHRRLALLTGEFRTRDHAKYLADEPDAEWNAMGEVSRSTLVHFSDWPLPKPWMDRPGEVWNEVMPGCDPVNDERDRETDDRPECADRMMWVGFYESYDSEREKMCSGRF